MLQRMCSVLITATILLNHASIGMADEFSLKQLPMPGKMVPLSALLEPPILKGIKVDLANPLHLEFILNPGQKPIAQQQMIQEVTRLVKYFMASMTIPEKDLWVNLSPYESKRIIPQSLGLTELGRDLLGQDYVLKQVTASLIYPEGAIGKAFWSEIYKQAARLFGTTDIKINTFNKVWIVPESEEVWENLASGDRGSKKNRRRLCG